MKQNVLVKFHFADAILKQHRVVTLYHRRDGTKFFKARKRWGMVKVTVVFDDAQQIYVADIFPTQPVQSIAGRE